MRTAALLLLGAVAHCAVAMNTTFVIVHTNDFHGHLAEAEVMTTIKGSPTVGTAPRYLFCERYLAKAAVDSLVLDAGDTALAAPPISQLVNGSSTMEFFNLRGVAAIAVGNHDFDKGIPVLRQMISKSTAVWLSSNIVLDGTEWQSPEYLKPYAIFTMNTTGIRVGVIGVTTPNTPQMVLKGNVDGLTFKGAVESISHYYAEVRNQSDYMVLLAHIGLDSYNQGSTTYPGTRIIAATLNNLSMPFDYVISGHDHRYTSSPYTAGSTKIVEVGKYGEDVGQMLVTMDNSTGSWAVSKQWYTGVLTNHNGTSTCPQGFASDAQALVAKWNATVAPYTSVVIGVTNVSLTKTYVGTYGGESNLGSLIAASMKWYGDFFDDGVINGSVDMGFMNTGGVRSEILVSSGNRTITWGDTFTVLPFNNNLFYLTLTGLQVLNLTAGLGSKNSLSAGLSYTYMTNTTGSYVCNVFVNGELLNLTKNYRCVVNSYEAQSQTPFSSGTSMLETGILDNDALNAYISNALGGFVTEDKIAMGRGTQLTSCNAITAMSSSSLGASSSTAEASSAIPAAASSTPAAVSSSHAVSSAAAVSSTAVVSSAATVVSSAPQSSAEAAHSSHVTEKSSKDQSASASPASEHVSQSKGAESSSVPVPEQASSHVSAGRSIVPAAIVALFVLASCL